MAKVGPLGRKYDLTVKFFVALNVEEGVFYDGLAVPRIVSPVTQAGNGDVVAVGQVPGGRIEKRQPIRVGAEKVATPDAAAVARHPLADVGHRLWPEEPQAVGLSVVFL